MVLRGIAKPPEGKNQPLEDNFRQIRADFVNQHLGGRRIVDAPHLNPVVGIN